MRKKIISSGKVNSNKCKALAREKKRKKRKKVSDEKIEVLRVGCSLNRQSWQVDRLTEKCRAGNRIGCQVGKAGLCRVLKGKLKNCKKYLARSPRMNKKRRPKGVETTSKGQDGAVWGDIRKPGSS